MQQGNFIDVFLARHVSVAYVLHQEHLMLSRRIWFGWVVVLRDRLCGLVVKVSGYRYRGPGFDPRRYQTF